MVKKKVGIITWHYYNNFGSALQAYALQTIIENFNYDVSIINYRNIKFGKYHLWKIWIKYYLDKSIGIIWEKMRYPYISFQKDFLCETKLMQDVKEVTKFCNLYDVIVCGSDQIWAPNVFNSIYMLDGISKNVTKISYAASLGLNSIPEELAIKYQELLKEFKYISVREEKGKELLEIISGISSSVVLDPTLLIDNNIWISLEKKPYKCINERYIFCYFLNENHKYKENVQNFANKSRMKIVGYSVNSNDREWMDYIYRNIGPREFLWLIHNAEYIITDSYHGTIFSLLYHKKFVTLERFEKNDILCQNSRIYQLKKYFKLDKQVIVYSECETFPNDSINYVEFEYQLHVLRKNSYDFLQHSLED